jgi:peptidoglycan/xylan/chitin deacetylase (PgdA/CDA1 family)
LLFAFAAAWMQAGIAGGAHAEPWIEPIMRMAPDRGPPTIALTFDACGGRADNRILDVLIGEHVPATIFVTSSWLRRNPEALARLRSRPDLFQIENHGHRHLPAIDRPAVVYGLKAAGSPAAVAAEIELGRNGVKAATGRLPGWYRGAAALYSRTSLDIVAHLGQRLAGHSIAADGGAQLSRSAARRRMLSARDGEVLLMHINHPERPSGQGVAEAIVELRSKGYRFVRLNSPGLRFITQP